MRVTFTHLNITTKRHGSIEMSCYLNNSKGFTLAELITSIAIIGILAAVGIQQYSQYKVRGYDAHSKQALHDMNLTCNAFWSMEDTSDECDLEKSKEYGFVQHPNVVANLPSSMLDTFCASAKHNSSPNTYSMDSAALISEGKGCKNQKSTAEMTKVEQVSQIFNSNCALLQETVKLCSSQNTPISHVDDDGREWEMDCPVTDPRKAKEYYEKLIGNSAINGANNPYYNPDRSTRGWVYPPGGSPYWDEGDYNPFEKVCCYELEDHNLNAPPSRNMGRRRFYENKYSGMCGLGPKSNSNYNRSFNNKSSWYQGGPTNKSPNIRMICNMGQEEGDTLFRACDLNLRTGDSGVEDFSYDLNSNKWKNRSACEQSMEDFLTRNNGC